MPFKWKLTRQTLELYFNTTQGSELSWYLSESEIHAKCQVFGLLQENTKREFCTVDLNLNEWNLI